MSLRCYHNHHDPIYGVVTAMSRGQLLLGLLSSDVQQTDLPDDLSPCTDVAQVLGP